MSGREVPVAVWIAPIGLFLLSGLHCFVMTPPDALSQILRMAPQLLFGGLAYVVAVLMGLRAEPRTGFGPGWISTAVAAFVIVVMASLAEVHLAEVAVDMAANSAPAIGGGPNPLLFFVPPIVSALPVGAWVGAWAATRS